MNIITITAGVGQDRDGNPIPIGDSARAIDKVRGYLATIFGGYTETNTHGGWIADDGTLVTEVGRQWSLTTNADRETILRAAHFIRDALNQHSVMLTEVKAELAAFPTHTVLVTEIDSD